MADAHSQRQRRVGFAAVRVVVLAMFALATYRAVLSAWADVEYRKGSPAAVREAERLMPSDAVYHYSNALLMQQNDPMSPVIESEFAAAVQRNPRYSDALMAWSVEKELRGDKSGAEKLLLQAQSQDRLLRPAWALANFYYRQGDTARFLQESRESLRIIGASGLSEGRFDPGPIFALCWNSGASPTVILDRVIPPDRPILGSYLNYLMATGKIDAARECAARLLPTTGKGELFLMAPYVNLLINHNLIAEAVSTWNQLERRGAVSVPGPDPDRGVFLSDPEFSETPLDFGFDWRRAFPDSIQFTYSRPEHTYRFDIDGNEPEQFALLDQTLPLLPGRSYRFSAHYRSDADPQQSGLWWSFFGHESGQPIPGKAAVVSAGTSPTDDSKILTIDFDTPPNIHAANLRLAYSRQLGMTRFRGYYELSQVELKLR